MRDERWERRPWSGRAVRVAVVVAPAVAGTLAGWATSAALPEPSGSAATVGWWVALIGAVVVVVVVTQHLARRFLPLAWLLGLSMAFPDRAPSRLATARRAARRRVLPEGLVRAGSTGGLGSAAGEAAESALVLVAALGAHDRRTRGHSERVRALADVLAEEAGVSAEDRDRLRWSALLHDIGKLTVPGEILNKPDRPDEAEWARLRRHPEEGDRLVAPLVAWLGPWAGAVGHHHEKWDGTGYPNGLAGEGISLGGRILAVADAYEVMTATRPYKSPMRPDVARRELVGSAGTHFDPGLVRHFLAVSLPRLWWTVGGSAFLSLFPWLGRLLGAPLGEQLRRVATAPAAAATVVGGLLVAGLVSPPEVRQETVASAAPAPPPAPAAPVTESPAAPLGESAAGSERTPSAPVPPARRPVVPATPSPVVPAIIPPPPATEPAGDGRPAATPDSAGRPTPEPEAAPPVEPVPGQPFRAVGIILAPSLTTVTGSEPVGPCRANEPAGAVRLSFRLPEESRRPGAAVAVGGSDLLGLHDLDVAFYTESCEPLGTIGDGATDPSGVLPEGAAWLVVTERRGVATTVSVAVS